jgi:hypothetical protein
LGTLTEGTPHQRQGLPREGGSMEVVGAVPNRAKAKRRKACDPWVSRPTAAKPNFRWTGARIGDGVGTKFGVLTQGDLSASAGRR